MSATLAPFSLTVKFAPAHVEVDPNTVNPPPNALPSPSATLTFAAPTKKKRVQLQSATDPLFAELRDKNFAVVGGVLNRVARRINADYESRHAAMQGSVSQMRNFVGKLHGLQAEHQALRLRGSLSHVLGSPCLEADYVDQRHGVDGTDHANHNERRVQ